MKTIRATYAEALNLKPTKKRITQILKHMKNIKNQMKIILDITKTSRLAKTIMLNRNKFYFSEFRIK